MSVLEILTEAIDGYLSGGAEEAVSEGIEETAEEATGEEF
ncbi:hypothetical protein C477_02149 [Haloterrigena salina JCM 13891]|uniref:Uncharacterized protein n=1 Tax=Haloterrigena salina JCM 13891 TaxID=1227488 RepID=M0CJ95_9EURY|nr:hypothetical protein C477_02149 [Haloterrigena salina JCM 13891]